MAGYARQSSSSIADGEVITAAPLNSEFDALLAAFAFSGGHNHDGTSTEGAYVGILADVDALNKIVVDTSNNRHGFFVEVSSSAVEQIRIQDGAIVPVTDNDIDLGASSNEFKDLYLDGTANIDTLAATTMSGDLAMGSNKVTGLAAPTADGDAARKAYVDASISAAEGLTQLAGNINVNGFFFFGSSGEDVKFQPQTGASVLSTQDTDGEFIALVLRNESDAADTTGIASLRFDLEDTGGNTVDAAKIAVKKEQSFTATASTQDSKIVLSTSLNGTLTEYLELTSAGALVPVTDNTVDIGTSSKEIKDIYVDGTAFIDAIGFGSTSMTLPTADGSANQVLRTDGSGTLSFADDTGTTINNATENELVTVSSTTTQLDGEANLTFDGTTLTLNGKLAMASNTAGKLLIADGTDFEPTAVGDLSEISSIANDDVLLAVDASGGGLKRVSRSTLVSGLATSGAISNVVEDTTPQLGGDLDVNGNGLVSTSNGNIALTPNGSGVVRIDGSNGIDMQSGAISIKNSGAQSYVRFYCEVSNAHYAQLQAPAHSDFSGNITLTLPATTDTLVGKTTTDTLTNKTLTSPVLNTGVSGTAIADEDDMSSNSATKLATQQSIKAYVDAQITAEDLDITSDSGTIAIDLDSETLTIAGGTGLASSATSNTVTLAIDSTVTTLTGSQTLTNKTLTSPVIDTGVSGTAILDEDNLASDSASKLATQQSIKAYVDSSTTGMVTTTGSQTLTNKTLTSPVLNTGVSGTAVLDEDDLSSNSATKLATQQSIKAYVDNNAGGGGIVELVADGSITAGKPVILTSAGKAQQVQVITTNYDPLDFTIESTATANSSDDWYSGMSVYNSTSDTIIFSHSTQADGYPYLTPATPNGDGSFTKGVTTVLQSVATYGAEIATNTGANEFLAVWTWVTNTDGYRGVAGSITGSGSSKTISVGSVTQIDTKRAYHGNVVYDANVDRYVVVHSNSNHNSQTNAQIYAYNITVSGTSITVNNSGGTQIMNNLNSGTSNVTGSIGLVYDSNVDRILVLARSLYQSSAWKGWTLQTIEATSSAINGASNTPVLLDSELTDASNGHGLSENCIGATYSPDDQKIMISYIKRGASDDDNRGYAVMATLSSNSVSLGTRVAIDSDPAMQVATGYDELVNKFIVYRTSGTGTSTKNADYYTPSVSGTSITMGSAIVASGTTGPRTNNHFFQNLAYVSTNYATYNLVKGPDFYIHSLQSRSVVNNLNTDGSNLLGIAAESISDTATGKLTIVGGINENQSSLAIGTNYFTNNSGVVGTSGVAFLGRAIAADKIQIESAKEELDVGTSANNLVQLDSSSKLPAVDGSQLTNLPAPSDARVFCGAVDFRRDSGVSSSVILSKLSDLDASEIRAYEIHFYGVGVSNDTNYNIRFKPYKSGSSVMSGSNFNGIATGNYNGSSYTSANDSFSSYLSFRMYGADYPYRNPSDLIQNYNGNGYGGKFNAKVVYENNFKNAAFSYQASVRTGANNFYMNNEMGSFSASGSATTTDYAEQFYFYTGTGSFEEGVIALYAIKK